MAVAGNVRTWCADASIPRTPCSIRAGPRFPRCSWFGRRTGPRGAGSTRASPTQWKSRQATHRLADRQSSPSCSSPRHSGCTSRRPPQRSAAGSSGCTILCSDPRWPRSTQLRDDGGRLTTLLPRPGCHARRSLPRGPRTFADPLSQRMEHARGTGPAGHHGHHGRGDRPQSGIRRGRGVQPGVQTRARTIPRLMAHSSAGQVRTLAMC